jgi:hypothetical protein
MSKPRPIRIGDKVRTLDRLHSGKVTEIHTYTGMGNKLLVQLQSPHFGQLLLAVELWARLPP